MSTIPAFLTPLAAFNQQANSITSAVTGQSPGQVGLNNASTTARSDNDASDRPTSTNAAANQLRDSLLGNVDKVIEQKADDLGIDLSKDMTRVEKVAAILSELGADSQDADAFKKDLATALGPLGKTINLGVADLGKFATDTSAATSGYQPETLREAVQLISSDTTHWAGAKQLSPGNTRGGGTLQDVLPSSTIASNPNARAA